MDAHLADILAAMRTYAVDHPGDKVTVACDDRQRAEDIQEAALKANLNLTVSVAFFEDGVLRTL